MKLNKQILVLPNERYVFFLSAKCASSSIRRMAIFDLGYSEPLAYITDLNGLNLYRDFTWIYLVREPNERLRSLWKDKVYRICHGDFRKLNFRSKMSFNDFALKYKKLVSLSEYGAHLWPMSLLFFYFRKGRNKIIIDIKDWKNWPDDLPKPRWDNKNKINVSKEKDNLKEKGRSILYDRYKKDFEFYKFYKEMNAQI